jgi:GNAT superfamily N-acetyltransferase
VPTPTETLRIGRLRRWDAGEVLTVQRAAYVTEAQRYSAPHIPPLLETLDELRCDVVGSDVIALGAWLGSRLVGSVRGRVAGPTMEVARLSVAPDVQGRGVGTALLTALHAAAPAAVTSTWLVTGAQSDDNCRFYAAAGYRATTTKRDAAGVELVHMVRSVAAPG